MVRLKLDPEVMGLSSIMERISHVHVKDCFKDGEMVYFIVESGEMGRALGKAGSNVKRVQEELGKRVKVIEYSDDLERFVHNIIAPLAVERMVLQEGALLLQDSNKKTKSLLIGRESKNLMLINRVVRRFFNIEIKIL